VPRVSFFFLPGHPSTRSQPSSGRATQRRNAFRREGSPPPTFDRRQRARPPRPAERRGDSKRRSSPASAEASPDRRRNVPPESPPGDRPPRRSPPGPLGAEVQPQARERSLAIGRGGRGRRMRSTPAGSTNAGHPPSRRTRPTGSERPRREERVPRSWPCTSAGTEADRPAEPRPLRQHLLLPPMDAWKLDVEEPAGVDRILRHVRRVMGQRSLAPVAGPRLERPGGERLGGRSPGALRGRPAAIRDGLRGAATPTFESPALGRPGGRARWARSSRATLSARRFASASHARTDGCDRLT